ncbi:hypothetical protein evm_008143 [Chilo suppressalis]|nr:hypothetical protein evm_008143 [Chilo suppressalis]
MPQSPPASIEQLEALLKFMESEKALARGLLRGPEGRVRAKRLWAKLCNSLNSMGNHKTVEQWQKLWADRKHLTKKAMGVTRWAASGTSKNIHLLSQLELKILSIMGQDFIEPERETKIPMPTTIKIESRGTSPEHVDCSSPVNSQCSQQASSSSESGDKKLPIKTRTSTFRRTRPRVTQQPTCDSATRRLIKLEEQRLQIERTRNKELSEIKVAIVELCNLVREFVKKDD